MSAVLFEPLWRGANWLYGYYISFDETGVSVVDNVLAAIADAGKAYHNTIDWNNEPYDRTESCVDSIQRMAGLAAERFSELENENERLKLETAEARQEARLAERKAIVAHLRAEAATSSLSSCQNEWRLAAKAIEDCHHMPREGL